MRGLYQEGPEERTARLADAALVVLLARLDDRRIEASVAGHLFGPGEAMGISQNGSRGIRCDEPDARDRQQHLDIRDVGDSASDLSLDPINLRL